MPEDLLKAAEAIGAEVAELCKLTPSPVLRASCTVFKSALRTLLEINAQKTQAIALIRLLAHTLLVLNSKTSTIGTISADTVDNVDQLESLLFAIQTEFEKAVSQQFVKRLLRRKQAADALARHHLAIVATLHLFQIESDFELWTIKQEDQDARLADSAALDEELLAYAERSQDVKTLLSAHSSRAEEMNEIKDLLHLCTRKLETDSSPGSPETLFYKTTLNAMTRLAGGRVNPAPGWIVSPLEVDCQQQIGGSNVYRAQWNGGDVAVKFVENVPEGLLLREVDALRKVIHPNIHRFLSASPSANPPFLVSALHQNGDVLHFLETHPETDRLSLIHDIAVGMQYLHDSGVLHGSLKASNILIDDDKRAIVSDFGMTSIKMYSAANGPSSHAGGDVRWMAPERIDGGQLTRQADVYAFAMVSYEVYTCELPFGFVPEQQISTLVVDRKRRPPRPTQGLPTLLIDQVWAIMERCWAHEVNDRPTFTEVVNVLAEIRRVTQPIFKPDPLQQITTTPSQVPPSAQSSAVPVPRSLPPIPLATQQSEQLVAQPISVPLTAPPGIVPSKILSDPKPASSQPRVAVMMHSGLAPDTTPPPTQPTPHPVPSLPHLQSSQGLPAHSKEAQMPPMIAPHTKEIDAKHLDTSSPTPRNKPVQDVLPLWEPSNQPVVPSLAPWPTLQLNPSKNSQRVGGPSNTTLSDSLPGDIKIGVQSGSGKRPSPIPSRVTSIVKTTSTTRKIVIVGDGLCGKSTLLYFFSRGTLPEVSLDSLGVQYDGGMKVDGEDVWLNCWDTPGQEDYDRLRPIYYPETHVVLIAFALDSHDSLDNVLEKWISEIRHFCPQQPIIVVGCKKGRRNDPATIEELRRVSQTPVTPEQGIEVAQRIGAKHYLECDAYTGEGVREVFQCTAREALRVKSKKDCVVQ